VWRGHFCPRSRAPHNLLNIIVSAVAPESNKRELHQGVPTRDSGPGFPRSLRLLRHADFDRVYESGRRHFSASLTVFYLPRPAEQAGAAKSAPPSGPRVGFTVGRALGGAVQRNRMKRRLREAVRLSLPKTRLSVDIVINPKKSLLTTDFEAVLNEVRRAFVVIEQRLGDKAESKSTGPQINRR